MAWNGYNDKSGSNSSASGKVKVRKLSTLLGALAGVLVVLLAAGVYFAFFAGGEPSHRKPATRGSRTQIAEVRPAIAATNVPPPVKAEPEPELPPSKRRVKTLSVFTNHIGQICERYQTADGKTHKLYRPSRPPLFKHQTDQLLAMALAGNDRRGMPPLPISRNLDKQFLESLNTPIEISPDDSPEIVARKKAVIEARKQVDALMREGIGFTQILADHQKLLNENKKIRDEMIREIKQHNAETDRESTQKALESVNAALENMGITPIDMPKTEEERAAAREAKRAAREARRAAHEQEKSKDKERDQ